MNDTQRRAAMIGVPVLLLVVGLIAGWILHNVFNPPGKTTTVASFGTWTLSCPPFGDPRAACELGTPVVDAATKVTVATIVMGRAPDGEKMVVTFPLNLGVLLVPGMGMTIGSDPVRVYHYDTCAPAGCMAIIAVDDKLIASMRNAKSAKLLFVVPTKDRKPIAEDFQLGSLDAALDAEKRDDGLRHSWWRRIFS